jgi:thymidine kinase
MNPPQKIGELHLILGCMRSGKSVSLIRKLQRYHSIGHKVFYLSSTKDTRCGDNEIMTHDGMVVTAHKTLHLTTNSKKGIFEQDPPNIPYDVRVIGVDECQFFDDLKEFVAEKLKEGYIIVLSGLDGDYQQKPFANNILDLIPMADSYEKLYAFCSECRDGTRAPFTKRINTISTAQELAGADDYYISVCRKHF